MTLGSFVVYLLIAAICGAIGQSLAGYSLGGCFVSAVVGLIGAYLGTWIADEFNFPEFWVLRIGGEAFPVIWAVLGSALFAFGVGLVTRRRR
ncbi:MAG: hypothetical protein AAGF99_07170 [Bacteroidota bacterium]